MQLGFNIHYVDKSCYCHCWAHIYYAFSAEQDIYKFPILIVSVTSSWFHLALRLWIHLRRQKCRVLSSESELVRHEVCDIKNINDMSSRAGPLSCIFRLAWSVAKVQPAAWGRCLLGSLPKNITQVIVLHILHLLHFHFAIKINYWMQGKLYSKIERTRKLE